MLYSKKVHKDHRPGNNAYTYSDAIFILFVGNIRWSDLITVICGISKIIRCGFIFLRKEKMLFL